MKSTSYVVLDHPPSLSGLPGVPQDRDTHARIKSKPSLQPPTSAPLRVRLEQLKLATKQNAKVKPPSQSELIVARLKAWVETMSPLEQRRPFTTEEVERLAGLAGKQGGRPACHHIAAALRAVGFKPCRDWTVAGRNKRYWKLLEN